MATDTIDHATFLQLAQAGVVQEARIVGRDGGWAIMVRAQRGERQLTAQRSGRVRLFKRFETLVAYLKAIGISRFDVDATGYGHTMASGQARPDRAEALRRTHEAAVHDRWFRDQVSVALREANDPSTCWVSDKDARDAWAVKRAEFSARLAHDGM